MSIVLYDLLCCRGGRSSSVSTARSTRVYNLCFTISSLQKGRRLIAARLGFTEDAGLQRKNESAVCKFQISFQNSQQEAKCQYKDKNSTELRIFDAVA
jgi:hypothetical protein